MVIALGSDGSARAGREILLAGVSDYLVKPVTAAAIREAALRATGNGAASPGRGCVAGFVGTGGSGTTTIAAAAALGQTGTRAWQETHVAGYPLCELLGEQRQNLRVAVAEHGVDAPPDGIAMCHVGSGVKAKRGKGRPWNRLA